MAVKTDRVMVKPMAIMEVVMVQTNKSVTGKKTVAITAEAYRGVREAMRVAQIQRIAVKAILDAGTAAVMQATPYSMRPAGMPATSMAAASMSRVTTVAA